LTGPVVTLAHLPYDSDSVNLAVELLPGHKRGLHLSNPVMTASGTFANGVEYAKMFDSARLGAIVSKAITLKPRRGNVQPRIVETAGGMLNSIGLHNIGLDAILNDVAPVWASWRVPVIANIAGESIGDYAELARRLDGVAGVSGIEMNISCPNVTDIVSMAAAVADAGADAVTLINTFPAMRIDVGSRRPALGWGSGGLSGPALKPIALRMVYQVARVREIPIIGCGGILSGEDAVEFVMAGASAVQVGTATFLNPSAPLEVIDGIEDFLRRERIEDIGEIVGAALPADQERAKTEAEESATQGLRTRS